MVAEARQILDEEQLAILADLGVLDSQAVQKIISNNAAFQIKDLDTYDSDSDDISNAKAVLMANISNYGSDVISKEKAYKEQNNESVTAELERYKERAKTFEQCLNIDLTSREKMIDSQMDYMIKEKLALKEQVDSLEKNLSKQIKEKECLLQTFTAFKCESKEKEDKNIENEIDLEKKLNELDKIIFKVGQSAQTVHMLTKPQVLYDNIHKQALGYQNLFYLKKAQRIKPTLYDGIVIFSKHVAMHDFGKRFVRQQELFPDGAFWYHMLNPSTKSSDALHVKIDTPKELPKVSLVNESLKKLKLNLANFYKVVKIRTTPNARTKVDKQCLEISKKELFLENDRLLHQIMSQDVLLTVMNSMSLIDESVKVERKRNESCDKCFNLEAELLKSQNAHNDLLKSSGLVPNFIPQQPCIPPPRDDWDRLFQPMFDEYFAPPSITVSSVQEADAPRAMVLADYLVSTSIDQDAPLTSIPSTQDIENSLIISQGVEESPKTPHFHDDPLLESLYEDSTSQGSSSNVTPIHTPFKSLGRWTKDHPIANMIGDPSRSILTRKQLQTDTM
uniref:Integrase, catalytic region, zinc finger, CCHC-type, peptidase aspartic, catalytic n=1 Tax=Tanacetum cinerariifolium TaxID=118510 RepID=A0A6L2JUH0_TANCI|nr:hypothetical protein [Tanacetum cinerariifolium]